MAVDADSADQELEEAEVPAASDDTTEEHDESVELEQGDDRVGRGAVTVAITTVVAIAGLLGFLGYDVFQSHQDRLRHNLFLSTARLGALNLTTIDHAHVEADVQRIVDSATGTFRDDFTKRSQPFIDVVKQAQSKSEGAITEAAVETEHRDSATVLVALTVTTSLAGVAEPQPRAWRMRITVQQSGDGTKVSNVEFVP